MKLHRDASNRLTAAVDVDASRFTSLVAVVVEQFALAPVGAATVTMDVAFREYAVGQCRVSLEWDNWMGFQVVALSPDAEPLVVSIAEFVRA